MAARGIAQIKEHLDFFRSVQFTPIMMVIVAEFYTRSLILPDASEIVPDLHYSKYRGWQIYSLGDMYALTWEVD